MWVGHCRAISIYQETSHFNCRSNINHRGVVSGEFILGGKDNIKRLLSLVLFLAELISFEAKWGDREVNGTSVDWKFDEVASDRRLRCLDCWGWKVVCALGLVLASPPNISALRETKLGFFVNVDEDLFSLSASFASEGDLKVYIFKC